VRFLRFFRSTFEAKNPLGEKNSRKNRENLRQEVGGFAMGNGGMLGTTCMSGQARGGAGVPRCAARGRPPLVG
jgi:hypothetical protein